MGLSDNIRAAGDKMAAKNLPDGQNTKNLQTQIATTATGKAQAAGQNLKQSNIEEQLGMLQARDMQTAEQTKGLDKASEIAAAEADLEVQQKEVASANRIQEHQQQVAMDDKMDQVMSDIEHSNQTLEDREDKLKIETVASDLRLKDKKYTHELEMIGKRERLNEKSRIATKLRELRYGNATADAYAKLDIKADQMLRKRQETEEDAMMNLADAFKIMEAQIEDEMKAAKISGYANIATTGVSAYKAGKKNGFFDKKKTKPIDSNSDFNTGTTGFGNNNGGGIVT